MKLTTICLCLILFVGLTACNEPSATDEDHDIAYCVDKDGNVVEEEKCEEGSEHHNAALFYWMYFPRTMPVYHVGQVVARDSGSVNLRPNVPTYKASVIHPNTPLRVVPIPPKTPGWGVRASTPPPRVTVRPTAPVRPVTPVRPVVVPRGR